MSALKLREGFYWTGIIDDKLRVFDIIMYTEFGTTYNSYAMKAGDKVILFETAKAKFWDEYLENLKEVIDVTKIDYLVVSHTEPDHAGSVEMLLDLSPQMKILATGCAIGFLKEIVNRDFVAIPVKDSQVMEIGGKTLRFMHVPNLHWPDTMYTFIEEEQILVTCDSFGSHYCLPEVVSGKITAEEDYRKALRYYYDCIIGPFKPFMLEGPGPGGAPGRLHDLHRPRPSAGGEMDPRGDAPLQGVVHGGEPQSQKDGDHPLRERLRLHGGIGGEDCRRNCGQRGCGCEKL